MQTAMASLELRTIPMMSQKSRQSNSFFSRPDVVSPILLDHPASVSFPVIPPPLPSIYCGRGDKKTAKGKRFRHSFGNASPRDKKKGKGPPRPPVPQSPPKKDPYEDDCDQTVKD